jgi:hypothetical protein
MSNCRPGASAAFFAPGIKVTVVTHFDPSELIGDGGTDSSLTLRMTERAVVILNEVKDLGAK